MHRVFGTPLMFCDLHRFFIAVARTALTNDGKGGSAFDPLEWSKALIKKVRINPSVRDLACLLGPTTLWTKRWKAGRTSSYLQMMLKVGLILSVSLLGKFSAFLETQH